MPRKYCLLAVLLLLAPGRLILAAAETTRDFTVWEREVAAFEVQDRASPPPKGAVLFIGSSTIRMWTTLAADFPDYQVINRGFGGTQIVDATHFADRLVFPHEPRAVFLRSGGNDLHAGKSAAQVFADFQEFVGVIHARLPAAKIWYISLCPTIARWSEADASKQLNALIEDYAKHTPYVNYIDTWAMSLDAEGVARPELFRDDKLHFSAAGYKLLIKLVRPYLPAAMGKK